MKSQRKSALSKSRHSMPFGAELSPHGVRFALWAPSARTIALDLAIPDDSPRSSAGGRHIMRAAQDGWHTITIADAKPGDLYGFVIDDGDDHVPDPASRYQPNDSTRFSQVIDSFAFEWTDDAWIGRPWEEAVVYEAHTGTATPDGTFDGLIAKLDHLVETGVTALQLMPIAETPGSRTWGYDGVLPFAINNSYGTPDDLKALVDAAHARGVMVFLDVVYNHFGPAGNFLHLYAEDFFTERHQTPWGAAINVDGGAEGWPVREFFIENALYWLEEYHFDGLRFDAVHAIKDDSQYHFLEEIARRIRTAFPHRMVHLILENESNEAHRLRADRSASVHQFDAQWDDDLHHCWHRLLTGEHQGYYSGFGGDTPGRLGRCLAEGFAYQGDFDAHLSRPRGEPTTGLPPQAFVGFLQNHDQIGNRAHGERLTVLANAQQLALARSCLLLSPQIPMLFMGEEWGSEAPFQYFVGFDHDLDLQQAIREGRAREFNDFDAYHNTSVQIPDPAATETFRASKLNWKDLEHDPFRSIFQQTKALIALRRKWIVPLLKSGFERAAYERVGAAGLNVEWIFKGGILRMQLNFTGPDVAAKILDGELVIWSSEGGSPGPVHSLQSWQGIVSVTLENRSIPGHRGE